MNSEEAEETMAAIIKNNQPGGKRSDSFASRRVDLQVRGKRP
jgi:hypothetical protein